MCWHARSRVIRRQFAPQYEDGGANGKLTNRRAKWKRKMDLESGSTNVENRRWIWNWNMKWKLERWHLPATVTYWVAGPVDVGLVGPVAGDILLIVSNTKMNVVTQNNVLFNNHTSKQQVHLILDWFEYLLSAQYNHWMRGLVYIASTEEKEKKWLLMCHKQQGKHDTPRELLVYFRSLLLSSVNGMICNCCSLNLQRHKNITTTNPVYIDSAFASYISVMITKTISVSWVG